MRPFKESGLQVGHGRCALRVTVQQDEQRRAAQGGYGLGPRTVGLLRVPERLVHVRQWSQSTNIDIPEQQDRRQATRGDREREQCCVAAWTGQQRHGCENGGSALDAEKLPLAQVPVRTESNPATRST
jgi:hypothetical protein